MSKAKETLEITPGTADSGLKAPNKTGKNFVLDTNVLIHDPNCLFKFGDNHVCVPFEVLSELDRFKNEQTDRGASARSVHRLLSTFFEEHPEEITSGFKTEGGGTIRVVAADYGLARSKQKLARCRRILTDHEKIDHRIIACSVLIADANQGKTILVTKDLNMQLKARVLGLVCEDYQNDKVNQDEVQAHGFRRISVEPNELQRFASSRVLEMEIPELSANQYVLLEAGEKKTIPARYLDGVFHKLAVPDALKNPKGIGLKPLNLGQRCLVDALLNPDIKLVTCFGSAGTGKTLVGVAAALHAVFQRDYTGITISRPVVPMGEGVGFLPGDLEEKLRPWLQPIYDALDYLMPSKGKKKGEGPEPHPYQELIDSNTIEIEALCYIRGRSIPNRFFVLDEAQQLSPLEAKTVVTRMSRGSKLVLIGDPAQIDNPYVDSRSNGLVYTRQKMADSPISAHISLEKVERSELAEAGAKLM
ncbi:MAG: PhoH family protein [Verrucomicrobiales bacterium]|nr:PhoH family protein [Verrucomicrobiales bacterium]